ncbi:hypothetical protein [Neobacillus sp. SuZ13]|uniref:hypothetical protein n=1 Tax=Neobacillus sp. SuZ13 TaxID=3047875 RepID=UPI0024BF8286|nr:hypothetical protein [Neobacillus sp. SuZ13]WHY64692.1 hypothetical protein QNH17_16325 [Neobacillus sp. SuZ13]
MYTNRRRERSSDNGLIYPLIKFLITIVFYLNIVEYIKKLSDIFTSRYFKDKSEKIRWVKVRRNRNYAIDLFIILKFLFVLIVLFEGYKNLWILIIVWYLIVTNIFTYFYYHLWVEDALKENHLTVNRVRRRFITLFISIAFMMLCYVYFYYSMTPDHFTLNSKDKWSNEYIVYFINSVTKSFAIDFESLKASDQKGTLIEISQVINMFIFVTLILAKSLPKADKD